VCGSAAHASCLGLAGVPDDEWACARCSDVAARWTRRASARANALSSPAALGPRVEEDVATDDPHRTVRPSLALRLRTAADNDERRWVARQTHLADSTADTSGRRSLRTVDAIRQNWAHLRTGVLSFSVLHDQPGSGRRSQALPEADAPLLAWQALEQWRTVEAQEAARTSSRRPAPHSPSSRTQPPPPRDGYVAHLAAMRQIAERRRRHIAPAPQQLPPPPLALPRVHTQQLLLRIPKRKNPSE
jgi:hypothetical protein